MSPRILLIEDNASDVELISIAFEEAAIPAEFLVYRDGDAALAGVRTFANAHARIPDLAFLDLNLPRASGHEVLAAIRAQPALAGMPVLILTTSNHPVDRSRCLAGGASDYLVKPGHFDALVAMVDQIAKRWLQVKK